MTHSRVQRGSGGLARGRCWPRRRLCPGTGYVGTRPASASISRHEFLRHPRGHTPSMERESSWFSLSIIGALLCACGSAATPPSAATTRPTGRRAPEPASVPATSSPRSSRASTPPPTYCADPEARRFHRIDDAHPGECANPLPSVSAALSQGYLPADECRPPMEPPRGGSGAPDACARDEDCRASRGSGCGCPPCGYRWPRPMNRSHHEWLTRQYAMESCPRVPCEACDVPSGYLEVRPVCVDSRCTLAYW